ncbi:MAG: RuvA, C-terminal domain, partial [Pseudomonadota bacterium]
VLELRGRFTSSEAVLTSSSTGIQNDVVSGLIALGYSEKEARLAVREVDGSASVSEGMRLALKQLSR